ncbi:MAG: ice-binding family protein [Deltaproteobacteria bacterium]|nr:ice-binding family protein [Rhodocyclaceae bacterium]MDP3215928.1 ice-binding family protein [Deltaproteobacteria bacterium]
MTEATSFRRRAPGTALLGPLAVLLIASCGPRSILGRDDVPSDVGAEVDIPAPVDASAADVPAARDAGDAVVPLDAVPSDSPDAPAPADVAPPDVTPMDAAVMDAVMMDAVMMDTAPMDVTDAPDAPDAPDVRDAPDAPDSPMGPGILGSAARFTILAGSTVSNTGLTTIVGEVGVNPGAALVGIPAGTVVHAADPVAALAQADTTVAYNRLAGLPCGTTLTGRDLGGMTLAPGVYCFTSSAMLTGTLFLDGQGQPNPLFIFQIGSTLVTSNVAAVVMTNGARSCGVYWQTGSSATVGIGSRFAGNILALGSVTLTTGVALAGRALARNGGVTLDTNSVSNAACPDPAPPADAGTTDSGLTDAAADRPDGG